MCGGGGDGIFCPQSDCPRKGSSFILAKDVHVVKGVSEQQAHCSV